MCFFSSFHFKPTAVTAFVRFRGNFWHEQEGGQIYFSFSEKLTLCFIKDFFFKLKKYYKEPVFMGRAYSEGIQPSSLQLPLQLQYYHFLFTMVWED